MNSVLTRDKLAEHGHHKLEIVVYGQGENYAIECARCSELLADSESAGELYNEVCKFMTDYPEHPALHRVLYRLADQLDFIIELRETDPE